YVPPGLGLSVGFGTPRAKARGSLMMGVPPARRPPPVAPCRLPLHLLVPPSSPSSQSYVPPGLMAGAFRLSPR
ncbi:MAG: hypothetical protein NC117_10500, partial [Pseudoflavonifractor sp.]|nr:hypothetical protein [Pseudoflavonifractor sp.]